MMKLSDLSKVARLAADLELYREAYRKCGPGNVTAHGDKWWVEYNYYGTDPLNRLSIPATVVCDFVTSKMTEIETKLRTLGVEP